jgi:hypothetical protein
MNGELMIAGAILTCSTGLTIEVTTIYSQHFKLIVGVFLGIIFIVIGWFSA